MLDKQILVQKHVRFSLTTNIHSQAHYILNNVLLVILTTYFGSLISDQELEFIDLNRNYNSEISYSEITDQETSLNWFKLPNCNFVSFSQKLTLKNIWINIQT